VKVDYVHLLAWSFFERCEGTSAMADRIKPSISLAEYLQDHITDQSIIKILEFGLGNANGAQDQLGEIYDDGLTNNEYSEEVRRLNNALLKIKKGKGTFDAAFKSVKTALSRLPLIDKQALDTTKEFYLQSLDVANYDLSIFETKALSLPDMTEAQRIATVSQLIDITQECYSDGLANVGKGHARKQAKRYVAGIQCLARWFRETLPDRAISYKEESLFNLYVSYWLKEYQGIDVNPERHIRNAIADLKKWKKLF
jgi:hypothetical protein